MAKYSSPLFFLTLFAFLSNIVAATPLVRYPGDDVIELEWEPSGFEYPAIEFPAGQRIILGYNGFNGEPRPPQASAGGLLGAVFYIADAVDLAKHFANGADHSKDYVCIITANANEWTNVPKVWLPQRIYDLGGPAINNQFPGHVIFYMHDHINPGGIPPIPAQLNQMGVRQAQIKRLDLQADCRPKAQFANDHTTLNYQSLIAQWNIATPLLSFSGMDVWLKADRLPWY